MRVTGLTPGAVAPGNRESDASRGKREDKAVRGFEGTRSPPAGRKGRRSLTGASESLGLSSRPRIEPARVLTGVIRLTGSTFEAEGVAGGGGL